MDTPGLFDTDLSHEEIGVIIVKAVISMHPGFNAVGYVIKLGVRYTDEEFAAYQRFKMLFGSDVINHMIVVFTAGDALKPGTNVDEMLKRAPKKLRDVLDDCNWRYVVFSNLATNKEQQVQQLVQRVEAMAAVNGGRPYVCSNYSKIGDTLEQQVGQRIREIEKQEAKAKKHFQEMEQELLKKLDELNLSKEEHEREMAAGYKRMEEERRRLMQEWETSLAQQQQNEENKRLQLLAEEERKRHELELRLLQMQRSDRQPNHVPEAALELAGTLAKVTAGLLITFLKK